MKPRRRMGHKWTYAPRIDKFYKIDKNTESVGVGSCVSRPTIIDKIDKITRGRELNLVELAVPQT